MTFTIQNNETLITCTYNIMMCAKKDAEFKVCLNETSIFKYFNYTHAYMFAIVFRIKRLKGTALSIAWGKQQPRFY